MEYIYIQREKDQKIIEEYSEKFKTKTSKELVIKYNGQQRIGIVGVHRQALFLIGLGIAFTDRFGESPIKFQDQFLLGLTGPIKLVGDHYEYIKITE